MVRPAVVATSAPNCWLTARRTSSANHSDPGTNSGRRNGAGLIGVALAAAACSGVIARSSVMRSSTQSRRALAASGKRNGL